MTVDSIAKLEALGTRRPHHLCVPRHSAPRRDVMRWCTAAALALIVTGPAAHAESARWAYLTTPDAMTNQPILSATTHSVGVLQFSAPYGGPQRATLTILRHPRKGIEVMLSVERGQFVCARECRLSVRFDDAPAMMALPASAADDGSTSAVFVTMTGLFMESLRVSHRVLIEATFYQEGNRVIEFATQGLEWEVTKEERDHASGEFLIARMDAWERCKKGRDESECVTHSGDCVRAYEGDGPAAGNLATALRCFDAVGRR